MPWRVAVGAKARRELRALPPHEQAAIRAALGRLSHEFGALDVKKLAGAGNRWRLRVGRWRVIMRLDNAAGVIFVTRVLARKDAYRD
jgi:mRNA-degrading endonuclease RelE of RelBE toxin-antitoxin system